jgi:type I restriction enzyme S subunit
VSWPLVQLDSVAFFQEGPGIRNWQFRSDGIKLINVKNIVKGQLITSNSDKHLDQEEVAEKYSHFLADAGDLVMASSGATWGKTAWIEEKHLPLCMNTSMIRFKSLDSNVLDIRYLRLFLDTNVFKYQMDNLITGSAQPNFGSSHLRQIKIPLPPLTEQKRIAAILDKADSLRRKNQQAIQLADKFLRAVFLDMFGDPVTNPKGWKVKTIEELVKPEKYSIKRGPFGGALKKEIFVESGYLVYEQYHALNNDFSFKRYFIDESKFHELKAFEVKPGDIIVSCSGVYLGKLAIVPKDARKGIINQALLKLSLNSTEMLNEVFLAIFTDTNFRNKFFGEQRGSGIPNFPPMSVFKEVGFICPPIELQNKYLDIINKASKIKSKVFVDENRSSKLFESLSQKAFAGKL